MARTAPNKSPQLASKTSKEQIHTQENFEKELKALAARAKEETWTRWATEQLWILIQSGTLLSLAALYSNVSVLSLSPVYGGIPSARLHSKAVSTACFLGWASGNFIRRQLPVKPHQLLPLIAIYIPTVQFFLFSVSGRLGAHYGPVITETLTYLPLLVLSVSCNATILDDLHVSPGWRWLSWLSNSMPGILSFTGFKAMEHLSNQTIQRTIGTSFVHSRLGLQIALGAMYSIFAPSKLLLFAVPAVLHTAIFNTHVPSSYALDSLNSTLVEKGWSILDRHESITGYISIFESAEQHFRVMRCDQSLLGGEWLGSERNGGLAEPIYGVFVMLEAVRLVEVKTPIVDSQAKALVVGLGIGTTPSAFIRHGIKTTIVEIDPVVHKYATKYFGLPRNHTPVIRDAVSYASELAQTDEKFDYIVHDVFTGGAEPVDLFTLEFIQDLRSILKPGGVIAINYAGDLLLPSARIIIRTIKHVFPLCRIFRESSPPSSETVALDGRDFTNMVIFCTNAPAHHRQPSNSGDDNDDDDDDDDAIVNESSKVRDRGRGKGKGVITFRQPRTADFLGSRAREMFLLPTHEVDERVFEITPATVRQMAEERDYAHDGLSLLRRNNTERFREWQEQSALGHWAVMRTVIPAEIWERW